MTFFEYVTLLQRRWRAWASLMMIGLLVALTFNTFAEKQYVAVSRSFVTVSDADAVGGRESFQGLQFVTQRVVSYAALSSSPAVLDGVIDELELTLAPQDLQQMVDVASPTGTVVLEVSVTHPDPQQAPVIADEVSRQLGLLIEDIETPRGLATSSVEVVLTHPAKVPMAPSSPRGMLNLFLGFVVGAAAGVLLALLRERFDDRLRSVDDIRAVTGSRPLGSTLAPRGLERHQLAALRVQSVEAEHYREVRAALDVTRPSIDLGHFAVCPPAARDGSASETANLAVSWALTGARVCVVDADLRRATVSGIFEVEDGVGLSDVLTGSAKLGAALTSWNDGMLTILPAGFEPQDPANLLSSSAMTSLTAELRSLFDIVIYDTGPVLEGADAIVLSRALDGVVLLVRAGRTTGEELRDCLEILGDARVPVLGTIRSGVSARRRAKHATRPTDRHRRQASGQVRQRADLSPSV